MHLCKIVAENDVDFEYLQNKLSKYPVKIMRNNELDEKEIPVLFIGWDIVKKLYPNHSILESKIDDNTEWVFSKKEQEDNYDELVEKFVNDSVKKWLPSNFILFDCFINNENLFEFVNNNINNNEISYLYFHEDALYLHNNSKNIIINIKSIKLFNENYIDLVTDLMNNLKCMCLSYKNIYKHINPDKIKCIYTLENAIWLKFNKEINETYFNILPSFDIKKYIPFIMSQIPKYSFSEVEKKSLKRACFRDLMTEWMSDRTLNMSNSFNKNNVDIIHYKGNKLLKVNYSNKRTITGRVVANDVYNPQNLDKKTLEREEIISRFKGGKIILFDYTSFETRIALYFSNDDNFINKFKDKDIHICTAQIIFGKNVYIDEEKRMLAKNINHKIIYGASKNLILSDLSFLNDSEEIYVDIIRFLHPILKKSKEIFSFFKENGFVINPWNTIIKPEKDFASFNNFIQSSAAEIIVDQIYKIKEFLKNYKSQFLFQVYDSLVFDVCPEESFIIKELSKIIVFYKDMKFNVSYSSGYDFKNLSIPVEVK